MEKEDSGYFFTLFQWVGIFGRHNVCEMRENSIWIYQLYFAISAAFFFWDFEGNNTTRKVLHFLYVETKARDSLVLSR